MPAENAITAHHLSKAYRIWTDPSQRLFSPLLAETGRLLPGGLGRGLQRRAAAGYRDFFALTDVSFEVKRGEAVGIVGRNGAGKSTLLQLIAGTLQPSAGSIEVNGRVAALLELGAGFNPDFTGRENVHLSAAVLGLSRQETESRFDEIAAFADIGDFLDQPVKTYSSGMMMRLAFAVNTCVDPDILIVDEALSVGDAPFQAKCFRRLRQLIEKGVSLLFVSHDLSTVRSICSRALWLKNGRPEIWGEAKQVAREYEKFCWQEQGVVLNGAEENRSKAPIYNPPAASVATEQVQAPAALFASNAPYAAMRERSRYGTGHVSINNVVMTNPAGEPATMFEYADTVTIWVLIEVKQPVATECVISFLLRDLKGNPVIATQDVTIRRRMDGPAGQRFVARTTLPLPLHHQKYVLHVATFGFKNGLVHTDGRYDFGNAVLWDVIEEAAILEVRTCPAMPLSGPVHLDRPVEITALKHPVS
ncbi:MAG: ABC transporter ATP-binding protein [Opitutae bacterium]|nr:ABC transporter ATP-binding protein [Opitutae bacterium]